MSYLFIDTQHGLSNRFRAIASAACIAKASGRELVVIWRPDHHCEARIGDLLDYDGLLVETDAAAEQIQRVAARTYNYMEIEPGSQFREPVDPRETQGDVYVRSAYTLESPLFDAEQETQFLRDLVPNAQVLDLVHRVERPADIAAHIRMATGPAFDHLSFEAPSNWPPERHQELTEWRKKSDVSKFTARLDQMLARHPEQSLFVAADLPATYAALIDRYGERVRYLPRDLYDRSPRQLQYALADLILLTAAPMFLASHWSSFSDIAQRLARPGRRVERSGIDF